jgi:hypothetical protein
MTLPEPCQVMLVDLETATGGLYTLMFSHPVARALGPDELRTMIADIAARMA